MPMRSTDSQMEPSATSKQLPHWPVSGSQISAYRCGGSGGVAEASQIEGFSAPHFPFTPTQFGLAGRIVGHQVMGAMYCS